MRRNTGLIGPRRITSKVVATGIFDTFDQINARYGDRWPAPPSYNSISPSTGSYNEGSTITFSISTSNVLNGTVLYYTIESTGGTVNSSDFTDGLMSGSFSISSDVGSFSKTLTFDATSEPGDSFLVRIRTDSISGTVVLSSGNITINNPSFSVTPSANNFNEGASVTFNVTTTNVNAQTMYYTLGGVSSADINGGIMSGSFFVSGTGSFTVTAVSDFTTEGAETLTCDIRINSTAGSIVASTSVTVNDTSTAPVATISVNSTSRNEDANPAGIGLISGTTYDATSLGPLVSIESLANDPGFGSLPASGRIKYQISKSTGAQTVSVAFKKTGTTISQSIFTMDGQTLAYLDGGATSILFYSNDDHDSMFMDADGRGCLARSNVNTFSNSNWDKFQATTVTVSNSGIDTVATYTSSSNISTSGTIVSFPGTTSAIWISFTNQQYKINNGSWTSFPAGLTFLGSGGPANSLWTISDGVNQFMIGRWNSTLAAIVTCNLNTNQISNISSVSLVTAPTQTNSTEEDCVGTQLFAVDGEATWYSSLNFYYGGTTGGWKVNTTSVFNTSGKSTFSAGVLNTQTDMDIFGSVDSSGYVWFADWGHDDGGLYNVGNDSQLGTRQTNMKLVPTISGSAGGGGGGAPSTDHIATFTVSLSPAYSGTYYYSTNVVSGSITAADFSDGSLTGSFTVTNGSGSFTRGAVGDGLLEGTEQYSISVRQFSTTGNIIGTSQTITINDTSKPVTATLTASTTSVNEGGSVTFTVTFSDTVTGNYGFTTTAVTGTVNASDFSDNSTSGTFSATSGTGTITRTLSSDMTTEGSESFAINVVVAGQVVGTSPTVTIGDTSLTPSVSTNASPFPSVNEGSSVTFTVTTTNFTSGTLYWVVVGVSGTVNAGDFVATSGSFTITNSAGSFTVTTTADGYTEGAEVFACDIRMNSTTGTWIGQTAQITINDTSAGNSYGVIGADANLVSHWDFSLLSQASGTVFNTTGYTIPNSSGTSIGSSSNTPSVTFNTSSPGTYNGSVSTHGTGNKKCLYRPDSTNTSVGAWFQTGANAWSDITSSTTPWSFVLVHVPMTARSSWNRVLRWTTTTWAEYQGNTLFMNDGGNFEFHHFAYQNQYSPYYGGSGISLTSGQLQIIMMSATGTSINFSYKNGAGSVVTGTGTFSSAEYGTIANRILYIGDNFYWNGNGAWKWCEIAWWSKTFTAAEQTTLLNALYNKWQLGT